MAWRLVVEVLDCPVPMTAAERLLLVCLAERADAKTRECWPSDDELQRRTGLNARGVRYAFARLAERGLEVRVPIGTGSDGRTVFAARGHQRLYRLPKAALQRHLSDAIGGTTVPPIDGGKAALQCLKGGTTVPP